MYANLTDEAKETLKQLSLIKDYLYNADNGKNGLYINTYENPELNLRNLMKNDYLGPLGYNKESIQRLENIILNELKEKEGRTFNIIGPTINNSTPAINIKLKNENNYSRMENGLINDINLELLALMFTSI